MDLETFKNNILFSVIHNEERYCSLEDLVDSACYHARHKYPKIDSDPAYSLYVKIALRIVYLKRLINLCAYLDKRGYVKSGVPVSFAEYKQIFKSRISEAKKRMNKLRPF